jgi:dienelactone hydrolase
MKGLIARLLLGAMFGFAQAQADQQSLADLPARVELLSIDSLTLSDAQFLTGDGKATAVRLGAELRLPQGVQKPPVVILLHGSSGLGAGSEYWARLLNRNGLATLTLDSFSGRGLVNVSKDQASLGRLNMVLDSYRARQALAAHPLVDGQRVALLGFSRGGQSALYASVLRFQKRWGGENAFMGFLAFYPDCATRYLDDTHTQAVPIRLFHGLADDYNGFERCAEYVQRLQQAGQSVKLYPYADSHHGFDYPLPFATRVSQGAQSVRNCQIEEQRPGELINRQTGKTFSFQDSCVNTAPHVGANLSAGKQARADALAQLCLLLGCREDQRSR